MCIRDRSTWGQVSFKANNLLTFLISEMENQQFQNQSNQYQGQQQDNQVQQPREPLTLEQVETKLSEFFEDVFTREKLQNKRYFIFKLSMALELDVRVIQEEKYVKSLTTDKNLIVNALKKCSKIHFDEPKGIVTLLYKPKRNKVYAQLDENDQQQLEEFTKYLEQVSSEELVGKDLSQVSCELTFSTDESAQKFIEQAKNVEFNGKQVKLILDEEDVYVSLTQSAQQNYMQYQQGNYGAYGYNNMNAYAYGGYPMMAGYQQGYYGMNPMMGYQQMGYGMPAQQYNYQGYQGGRGRGYGRRNYGGGRGQNPNQQQQQRRQGQGRYNNQNQNQRQDYRQDSRQNNQRQQQNQGSLPQFESPQDFPSLSGGCLLYTSPSPRDS
eukprot:TRINITY_DN1778_c0_g1_i9.p1 TRINITY_DN1778_c0_g1~~TRINITY_DN1778_c0_g1_i9.p1  ORF type:complete len:381 (+),score=83.53 TRINITY_DN1778_c0_g1_i9:65-1207(+)